MIRCGLIRGITFSIRHIMKMSALKNRIAITGSQLTAQFCICCVNDAWLGEKDVGCALDGGFFAGLGPGIDPCGENGEYHSFVHDGPIFRRRVAYDMGEKVYRPLELPKPPDNGPAIPLPAQHGPGKTKGFWFVDLLPA